MSKSTKAAGKYSVFGYKRLDSYNISKLKDHIYSESDGNAPIKYASGKHNLVMQLDQMLAKKLRKSKKKRKENLAALKEQELEGDELLNLASNYMKHKFSISAYSWVRDENMTG
eukprot:259770_1